jgi:integrase
LSLTFKQIIKSAIRAHYLPKSALEDICADISLPKYKKPQKRALTQLEKQAILQADLSPQKRAFISILYFCGLRKGEALALTPADFDWNNKTVSISKAWITYNGTPTIKPYPKSDNGTRVVPVPDAAVPFLQPYVEASDGYIFHGTTSHMMTADAYKRMWESIITLLNIAVGYRPHQKGSVRPIQTLTAHVLRHNYCTELCYQVPTISTKKIAQLMGDSEKMVLEVYSHIIEENEDASTAVNNIFS